MSVINYQHRRTLCHWQDAIASSLQLCGPVLLAPASRTSLIQKYMCVLPRQWPWPHTTWSPKLLTSLLWAGQHYSSCSVAAAGRGAGAIILCSEDAGALQDMPESCQHCCRWTLPKCKGSWLVETWQRGDLEGGVSQSIKLLAVRGVLSLYKAEVL